MSGVKKPYRYRPGTVALQQIRRYQNQEVAVPAADQGTVDGVEVGPALSGGGDRGAAADRGGVLGEAVRRREPVRDPRKKVTVTPKDMQLSRRIRGLR
jgi:hypothetical protein